MKKFREGLVLLGVAALLVLRSPALAESPAPGGTLVVWVVQVEGAGKTEPEARQQVLEQACELLQGHLGQRNPTAAWKPTPAYLDHHRMVRFKPGHERTDDGVKAAALVTLTQERFAEIEAIWQQQRAQELAQARHLRVQARHRLLGLILAGLAAALVVLKLYLWLEEATRGYSTNLLRSAALVLLAAIVGVLIWLA